jgi:hypothetical protein
MRPVLLLTCCLLLSLMACRKDTQHISKDIINPDNITVGVLVNGTIAGRVVDEQGAAVANAQVRLGQQETSSDANGFFLFRNAPLNQKGAYLQVEHPGHWHASRVVLPQHNGTHYTQIKLKKQQSAGQFDALAGGTVHLPEGLTLHFPPNAIAQASGAPYQGVVEVMAQWISPRANTSSETMPGALRGINSNSRRVGLQSFGMAGVQLFGSGGQRLNLAENAVAQMAFPLEQQLQNQAPAEIKLWNFDLTSGYWREEGIVLRMGDFYEAEVSHFSFWGVHADFEGVQLEGVLENESGDPLANTLVTVMSVNENSFETSYTNSEGIFSGMVPEGMPLQLFVSNSCNVSIYGQNLGTLTEDTDLGTLTVPASEAASAQLSGSLVNCDGNPVGMGMIQISWPQGYQYLLANTDGTFSQSFTYCDATEFQIYIVDMNSGQTLSLTEDAEPNIALGELTVCEGLHDEYISLNFNGEEFFYPAPVQFLQQGRPVFRSQGSMHSIQLTVESAGVGTYENEEASIVYYAYFETQDIPLFYQGGSCSIGECGNFSISISQYGAVGSYIEGTFTGELDMNTSVNTYPNAPVSGSFRVLRGM